LSHSFVKRGGYQKYYFMVILTPMQIGGKIRNHLFRYGFFIASLFRMTFDTRLKGGIKGGFYHNPYSYFLNISTELCPPKPNELEMAVLTAAFRA